MAFQSTVNLYNAAGIVGDLAFDGPIRAVPANLDSDTAYPSVIGYAYSFTAGGDPDNTTGSPLAATARAGGTGVFAGILINSKQYVTSGSNGALNPTLTLPDNSIGELLQMGEVFVSLPGAAAVGDKVYYDNTTGALGTTNGNAAFTGAIAAGGASTPDVLTVSAITAGNLGVGSVIRGAGIPEGTFIVSLGTGTGGTGTYNLSTINTLTVSSEAMTGVSVAPSGKTFIPNCVVWQFAVSGAGVGVIKLTN